MVCSCCCVVSLSLGVFAMKWHFLTAAQCFVHAVVIYRRGLHEGQRDQFVDAPNGLTAELPADGWQEQAVLCGEEDANPGETVPLRSKRGRKGKEWQSCEVIDAEKEKSLRICALDWLAKKAIIHDKLLLGSVGFRARFWSIFHFPVFETESFFFELSKELFIPGHQAMAIFLAQEDSQNGSGDDWGPQ